MVEHRRRKDDWTDHPDVIRAQAAAYRAEWLWRGIWGAAVLVVMFIITYDGIVGYQTRSHIIDCVDAKGECYAERQRQTAFIVEEILLGSLKDEVATRRIVTLAAACADKPGVQTQKEIAQCIREDLVERNKNRDARR